jgi:signal transduction histidine kinase/DNA-binding response OmpR family regulator/ligand-binding sensor domain-containing protein
MLSSLQILYAQQSVRLEQITIEDGLTQGMIHDILQDSLGFMWFATKDGLNRYDGYDFKLYNHSPADSFSLSGHVVNALFEDTFGRVWVGTHNQGLNILDRDTERFYKLDFEELTNQGLNSNRIFSIEQESDSIFWIGTGSGLCRLTVPEGKALWEGSRRVSLNSRVRSYDIEPVTNANLNRVTTCTSTISDSLYFGISNRVFRLHKDRYWQWEEISTLVNTDDFEIPVGFQSIVMTPDGHLLLPTEKDIKVYYRGKSWSIELPESLIGYSSDLTLNSKGEIWGASAGLFKIHLDRPIGRQLEVFFTTKPDYYTPTLYTDRNDIVWIGTNGYGIRKYNPATKRFNHFMEGHSTRQLYTDLKGRNWVWVPTSMKVLHPKTGEYALPPSFPYWIQRATWMLNPTPDLFWFHYPIVEDKTALVKVNERTGIIEVFEYTCKTNAISTMMKDRDGNIWFSSGDGQLVVFRTDIEQFEYFPIANWLPDGQENAIITVFHYDKTHDLVWAGSQYGLLRLHFTVDGNMEHKLYHFDINNPNSINEDYILSICKRPTQPDYLWIGTKGGGVNRFEIKKEEFEAITTKDGLPNNVAYGILSDKEGYLWITTNRGLCKFHPENQTFKTFTSEDGLQSNEFNTFSHYRAKDGRLLIGGVNGLHIFQPEDIKLSSLPPKVYLTRLSINNKPWDEAVGSASSQPLEHLKSISLQHDQDQLFFQFAALDYAAPDNNRYRYQMVGLDDTPVESGTRREVAYANLAPGAYIFKVWGANNEDIWGMEPATFEITISPPLWATNWAYLLYFVIIASLVYMVYRFQINRAQLRTQLAYEQREAERLAALDQMKSNFFSNITHEFRTPLTLILEPARRLSEQLKARNQQKWGRLIVSNSERMLNLVNQLLDINRLEEGLMPVNIDQVDLNLLLQNILMDFREAALARQINLELYLEHRPDANWVETDIEKVRKVVSNFLSNALKFTPEGGKVSLSTKSVQTSPDIFIEVSDNGPGIAPEEQDRIFDRFYQIDNSSTRSSEGTGIGLALCKELAQKLGGDIQVESQLGSGARFILRLPTVGMTTSNKISVPNKAAYLTDQKPIFDADGLDIKVLIIEDNEDLRAFLVDILSTDYDLETATDGIAGLQLATTSLPDLIITDVMMPRMDGFDMTEKLKSDIRTSHIPIIMLTAKSALESRLTGLKAGADAYLPKPFYSEELFAQMQNLLSQRKRLQAYFQNTSVGTPAPEVPKQEHEFLERTKSIIEAHLGEEDFNVEQLSAELLLSRSQLHRKLKALTGQSAFAFLSNYRLQKAYHLLKDSRLSVGEVSIKVGFSTPQYFLTKFKEKYGYSPSEAPKRS